MKNVTFRYRNHRGDWEYRSIRPIALEFNTKPGFNYQPGWFLRGFCNDRQAERSFALSHIDLEHMPFYSLDLKA